MEVFEKMFKSNLLTELTQNLFKVQTFPMHIKRGTVLSLFLCLVRSFSISKFLVWFSTSNLKFGSIFQLFWQEWRGFKRVNLSVKSGIYLNSRRIESMWKDLSIQIGHTTFSKLFERTNFFPKQYSMIFRLFFLFK